MARTAVAEKNGGGQADAIGSPSNDAVDDIIGTAPYVVELTVEGTADILFHRWSDDAVAEKAAAAKGSAAKKTDNVDSYVWRVDPDDPKSDIGIPGEYLRMSIVHAAKFRQDPRSPRKSAMDLYKAAVVPMTNVATLGKNQWDYLDRRRVTVQRNGVTRVRPAFLAGWQATFQLQVVLPEYVSESELRDVVNMAGKVIGLGDFRPTFGRFSIVHWERLTLDSV